MFGGMIESPRALRPKCCPSLIYHHDMDMHVPSSYVHAWGFTRGQYNTNIIYGLYMVVMMNMRIKHMM